MNSHHLIKIGIYAATQSILPYAQTLSGELSLPLILDEQCDVFDYVLHVSDVGLKLLYQHDVHVKPFWVDFQSKIMKHRLQTTGQHSPIARAIGGKRQHAIRVVDATAGFGRDSFILANLGAHVILLEHTPLIAILLADGIKRVRHDMTLREITARMTLKRIDAVSYLTGLTEHDYPDVVYLDPMFPQRTKTAKVKKEMQLLQALAFKNEDAALLLSVALKVAVSRVVVKRPRTAPHLTDLKPHFMLKTPTIRFDVYLTKK